MLVESHSTELFEEPALVVSTEVSISQNRFAAHGGEVSAVPGHADPVQMAASASFPESGALFTYAILFDRGSLASSTSVCSSGDTVVESFEPHAPPAPAVRVMYCKGFAVAVPVFVWFPQTTRSSPESDSKARSNAQVCTSFHTPLSVESSRESVEDGSPTQEFAAPFQ